LENAKANDSIAYLRFWFRDPRQDEEPEEEVWHDARAGPNDGNNDDDDDDEMPDARSSEEVNDLGGVHLSGHALKGQADRGNRLDSQPVVSSGDEADAPWRPTTHNLGVTASLEHRTSSGDSNPRYSHEAVFGNADHRASSASSVSHTPDSPDAQRQSRSPNMPRIRAPIELEAVVSCTSDGLVVCLRRARPLPLLPTRSSQPAAQPSYVNGLFAVPWATDPILPPPQQGPDYSQGFAFATASGPGAQRRRVPVPDKQTSSDFMNAIREIGVFAWALAGINGSMADYGHGRPFGESQPAAGLPIWRPENAQHVMQPSDLGNSARHNGMSNGGSEREFMRHPRPMDPFGDPGLSARRRDHTYNTAPPTYSQEGKGLNGSYNEMSRPFQ